MMCHMIFFLKQLLESCSRVFFCHIIKTLTSVFNSQLQSEFCLILKIAERILLNFENVANFFCAKASENDKSDNLHLP